MYPKDEDLVSSDSYEKILQVKDQFEFNGRMDHLLFFVVVVVL